MTVCQPLAQDTIATLAFLAAKTEKIKIGSGIILLAQRNPIVLAKELAGIDVLSKGRLLFGLGVGYVEGEFDALGIPYAERGPRATEHIEVIRTLWSEDMATAGSADAVIRFLEDAARELSLA